MPQGKGTLSLGAWLLPALLLIFLVGCSPAPSASVPAPEAAPRQAALPAPVRKDVQTILIMGLDDYHRPEATIGYLNDMQADFNLLLILDASTQTILPLHINRDTMTKIRRLGVFGDNAGSFVGQLALAHTYGSGGSDSCLNAVKAVSGLLGGIPIDHYMTFTMESVPIVNDAVGGVPVVITDYFSAAVPEFEIGSSVVLQGQDALIFVRDRQHVGDMTNLSRMERQRVYMSALYDCIIEKTKEKPDFLQSLVWKLSDAFMTDCTLSQMEALSDCLTEYSLLPFRTIPGEAVKGEEYMEYHVDQAALEDLILDLFYE